MKPAPNTADQEHRAALQKAVELDKHLEPALRAIYRRLYDALQSDQDRALFQLYAILQTGSNLSLYAPRYLLAADATFGDVLELYATWARKARELLEAAGPISPPAPRRKTQSRAAVEPKAGRK